jgi:beta-lactamase class A
LCVLNQVEKSKLSLEQKIHIDKKIIDKDTWSPIRVKYPNGNVDLTLNEIIKFTISQSDNIGCDILFKLVGGTKNVNDYIHSLGFKNIAIAKTEAEMHSNWKNQFKNWCQPNEMLNIIEQFYNGKILSKNNTDYLYKTMTETTSGPKRLKGLLPEGTVVAHKTGSSGANNNGITAALNDIGIVTLPNSKHFAIVVYITNSKMNNDTLENVIARISKVTWDYYNSKN